MIEADVMPIEEGAAIELVPCKPVAISDKEAKRLKEAFPNH